MRAAAWVLLPALAAGSVPGPARAASPEPLPVRRLTLELDGPPAAVLSADLDGDGHGDLFVATAFTRWGEKGVHSSEMVDGKLFETTQIIPFLEDRREMRLYRGLPGGGYETAGEPQSLPFSVLAFDHGPPGSPILALTDDGVASIVFDPSTAEPIRIVPVIVDPPVFAGAGTLVPRLGFTADADGDGVRDVLLPAPDGLAIYPSVDGRVSTTASARLSLPGVESGKDGVTWRRLPLPEFRHLDGDPHLDLVLHEGDPEDRLTMSSGSGRSGAISVLRGLGGGKFGPASAVRLEAMTPAAGEDSKREDRPGDQGEEESEAKDDFLPGEIRFFGDLDGDRRAELVTSEDMERPGGDGLRHELKEAKRPLSRYRIHSVHEGLTVARRPVAEFEAEGHPFAFEWLEAGKGGFFDLDGDGRLELVTFTLDFSLWQAPKILIARTIGAGLEFHIWQDAGKGGYREAESKGLSGKLKLDLAPTRLLQFPQLVGDFNADGRTDFIRVGGGREISIHSAGDRHRYPPAADLTVRLDDTPADAGMVRLGDFDQDGRSDVLVIVPLPVEETGTTVPTRLEFYLVGAGA